MCGFMHLYINISLKQTQIHFNRSVGPFFSSGGEYSLIQIQVFEHKLFVYADIFVYR